MTAVAEVEYRPGSRATDRSFNDEKPSTADERRAATKARAEASKAAKAASQATWAHRDEAAIDRAAAEVVEAVRAAVLLLSDGATGAEALQLAAIGVAAHGAVRPSEIAHRLEGVPFGRAALPLLCELHALVLAER